MSPARARAGRATVTLVVQLLVAVFSAAFGYTVGLARYDARIAVLESQMRDVSQQVNRIADALGAHTTRPAALRRPARRVVVFFSHS